MNLLKRTATPSLFILVFMISVGPFGDTLYTPSLPEIAKSLLVDYSSIQLTMTSYLFGYASSQLMYGPISDRFGRRPVMLTGALFFVIGSIICLFSYDLGLLIFGRFVQGLGACAGAVISSAAVRDAFLEHQQGKVFAKMNIAFAIAPGVGPIVGTFIAHYMNWHMNFLLLLILSSLLLLAVFFTFPETIKDKNRHAIHPVEIIKNYMHLFMSRGYLIYLLLLGINVGIVYACLVEAPGLLIDVMHLAESWFLVIALGIVMAFMFGSWLCSLLCSYLSDNWILVTGMVINLLGSMLLWSLMYLDVMKIWALLLPIMIIFIGIAFIIPIATAKALAPFNITAGSASAMMGFFQMGLASLITGLVTVFNFGRIFTMPVYFTFLAAVGLIIMLGYIWFNKNFSMAK